MYNKPLVVLGALIYPVADQVLLSEGQFGRTGRHLTRERRAARGFGVERAVSSATGLNHLTVRAARQQGGIRSGGVNQGGVGDVGPHIKLAAGESATVAAGAGATGLQQRPHLGRETDLGDIVVKDRTDPDGIGYGGSADRRKGEAESLVDLVIRVVRGQYQQGDAGLSGCNGVCAAGGCIVVSGGSTDIGRGIVESDPAGGGVSQGN